jgi:hypothetical protein
VSLDVVVPALRTATIDRLLASLAEGRVQPNAVSLVSNEVPEGIETHGLEVRLLRFHSDRYPIGDRDLALRRDVGIWCSDCTHVLTLDDDLVAPANLVETSLELLGRERHFWGHHRYISFEAYSPERLLELPPERGRAREKPPNSWHLWLSCYGGAFGAERTLVLELGGFDLAFSCRQSGEDQSFGKRLAARTTGGERVFIHEPPFAWHPTVPEPWGAPAYSNLCEDGHELEESDLNGMPVSSCRRCPYFLALDEERLFSGEVFVPYDPDAVEVTIRRA